MSIVAVMVASAIAMTLIAALTTFLNNVQKGTRGVDLKLKSQDFGSIIRYSVAKPDNCKVALNLDAEPIKIETAKLPVKSGTYTYPLPTLVLTNKVFNVGVVEGPLKVTDLSLIFPPALPSGEFIATLNVSLAAVAGAQGFGASQFAHSIPLQVSVEKDGTLTIVKSCYLQNSIDGQATCDGLGGRWLEGSYMPKNRCSMSAELNLASNEGPDGIPTNGETSVKGERADECYYQPEGGINVQTYSCPGITGTLGGARCHFDAKSKSWGIWSFDGNNKPIWRYVDCTKGVRISSRAPSVATLAWNQELHEAYGETSYDYLKEIDRLHTVKRCKFAPDLDQWFDCSNSRTPDDALQGKVGSCVFVRGVDLSGFAGYIMRHNDMCGSAPNCKILNNGRDYTGWIRVASPRFTSLQVPAAGRIEPLLKEATGYPCFLTEVDKNVYNDPRLDDPTDDPPTEALATQPSNIKQCIMELGAYEKQLPLGLTMASAPAKRRTVIPCVNDALAVTSSDSVRNTFGLNKCWYVASTNVSDAKKSIRIANHFEGALYPLPTINRAFDKGWVQMQTYQLPPDYAVGPDFIKWHVPNFASKDYRLFYDSTFANHGYGYITANPCNVGVRVTK